MGRIVAFFLSAGLPERRARQIAFGLLILLILLGLWLAKTLYDRALIGCHAAASAAQQATADRAADAQAATRRRDDDARLEAEADALERTTENATDPLAARRRYYDCVRVQQQARAAGDLTPAC